MKVTAIGTDGKEVNGAKIDVSVAEDGSHILLDADKVLISGSIKADKIDVTDLMAHDLVIGNSIHSDKYLEDGSGGGRCRDCSEAANNLTLRRCDILCFGKF